MSALTRRAAALVASRVERAPERRWTHGQDMAPAIHPRMPTHVASGVLALYDAQEIDDSAMTAATRFYVDYVLGAEGVRDPLAGTGGRGDAHTAQLARVDASTRLREITEIIGTGMSRWLVAFVVDDLTCTAMADRYLPGVAAGRDRMRGRMTVLLTMLPGIYAAIDRWRKRPNNSD